MRRFVSFGPGLVVLLAVVTVVFTAPAAVRSIEISRLSAEVALAQTRLDQSNNVLEQVNQAARDVAAATLPGVVHIQARSATRRFTRASGSGWFFNDRGYIVTNAHVIEGAEVLRVELYDGRVRTAQVIGSDAPTDIAVLKIDPSPGVVPLRRATGQPLHIGDQVFAFGSPFGIKFSMSRGIVSGLGRSEAAPAVGGIAGYTNYIQTDAAINPGNSGGPLVDIHARIVGMNAAIANNVSFQGDGFAQGQSAGIGFAIPIQTVESVVTQLIEHHSVLRGFLGISLPNMEYGPDLVDFVRREEGVELEYDGAGVLVSGVPAGQPADKAGLRRYDIIVAIDDHPTPNSDVLRSLISVRQPGETVTLRYFRDGRIHETRAKLGAARLGVDANGQAGLLYIENSENMSLEQVRKVIGNR